MDDPEASKTIPSAVAAIEAMAGAAAVIRRPISTVIISNSEVVIKLLS